MPTIEVTIPMLRCEPSRVRPCSMWGLEISDMAASLGDLARTVGKPGSVNRLAQGPSIGPVACRVDLLFGDIADKRTAAEEMAEMTFFVAPANDFHGALDARIVIDHPRRFERVNNAKGAVEPAGEVLALQMRAARSFGPASVLTPKTLPIPSISGVRR